MVHRQVLFATKSKGLPCNKEDLLIFVIDFNGGMSYSYTLPAYNEKGEKKDIKFGTEKELREGAL